MVTYAPTAATKPNIAAQPLKRSASGVIIIIIKVCYEKIVIKYIKVCKYPEVLNVVFNSGFIFFNKINTQPRHKCIKKN